MVNFTNWEGELEVFEKDSTLDDDSEQLFNFAYTMGGNTLIIGNSYKLVEVAGFPGIYNIIKK